MIRRCRYNDNARQALEDLKGRCARALPAKEGVEPTNLFSRNDDVNQMNDTRLKALQGDEVASSILHSQVWANLALRGFGHMQKRHMMLHMKMPFLQNYSP